MRVLENEAWQAQLLPRDILSPSTKAKGKLIKWDLFQYGCLFSFHKNSSLHYEIVTEGMNSGRAAQTDSVIGKQIVSLAMDDLYEGPNGCVGIILFTQINITEMTCQLWDVPGDTNYGARV